MKALRSQPPAARATPSDLTAGWYLALAVVRGRLRDRRWLVVSLLTPLGVLVAFWLILRDRPTLLPMLFPAVVGLAVMLTGSGESTRLVSWREQGVLARLASTPLSLPCILLAGAGAQAVLGVGQGVLILGVGALLLQVPLSGLGAAGILVTLVLGSACFAAYGTLVAQAVDRPESANALYVFSVLPMFFLGGAIPEGLLPGVLRGLGGWLPMGLLARALSGFLAGAPEQSLIPLLGLACSTLLFAALAARFFRIS